MPNKTATLIVRVEEDDKNSLIELAEKKGFGTPSQLVRTIINSYLRPEKVEAPTR